MNGRALIAVLGLALAGCPPGGRVPVPAERPRDHGPGFTRDHAHDAGCEACHGPDPCARCHLTRAPADHRPGFAARPHGIAAGVDDRRCGTCHAPASCARCHR